MRVAPALLLLCAAASACGTEPSDLFTVQAVVLGAVEDDAGSPVGNARIRISTQVPSTQFDDVETTTADGNGRFALRTGFVNQPDGTALVRVSVTAPGDRALLPFDSTGFIVRVSRQEPPPDTLQLRLVLRARSSQ